MQRIDDALELGRRQAQPFLPGPQGRLRRFTQRRFIQKPEQRAPGLGAGGDKVDNSIKVSLEPPTHQIINIQPLTGEKAGEIRLGFARRLKQFRD